MDRYGYTLKKNQQEIKQEYRYHEEDLRLMTLFQLREKMCIRDRSKRSERDGDRTIFK